MISVLLPVLFLVYDSLRSRVTLQAVWLSRLWPGWIQRRRSAGDTFTRREISAQDRKTRDRDCVASQRFSALLVLEKPTASRSPARLRRVAGADSQNECR